MSRVAGQVTVYFLTVEIKALARGLI